MSVEVEDEYPRPKRVRGPSRLCPNRNALMARENRQRKKNYVMELEGKVAQLKQQQKSFQEENEKLKSENRKLLSNMKQMQSLLGNSTITTILRSINSGLGSRTENPDEFQRVPRSSESTAASRNSASLSPQDSSLSPQSSSLSLQDSSLSPQSSSLSLQDSSLSPQGSSVSLQDHSYTGPKNDVSLNFANSPYNQDQSFQLNLAEQLLGDPMFSSTSSLGDLPFDEISKNLDSMDTAPNPSDDKDLATLPFLPTICIHINPNGVSIEFCEECKVRNESMGEMSINGF